MKNLIFLIILLFSINSIHSQVLTRNLSSDQNLNEFIQFPIENDIKLYQQPELDFDKILEEDKLNGDGL